MNQIHFDQIIKLFHSKLRSRCIKSGFHITVTVGDVSLIQTGDGLGQLFLHGNVIFVFKDVASHRNTPRDVLNQRNIAYISFHFIHSFQIPLYTMCNNNNYIKIKKLNDQKSTLY